MPQFGGKNAKKKMSSSSSTKRYFTVVIGSKEHGLYVSSSPSSAARKAVSKLCATDKTRKVEFSIREITQGSKKKTYGPYDGSIEKLDKPIELKGRVIKYKPVAKLSGKTGAKKRGMIGGTKIYECYTKIPGTEYTFKIEELRNNWENRRGGIPVVTADYRLTINNSNPENTELNLPQFESYLSRAKHDQFIQYLIKESNEQKKNLIINFTERISMRGDHSYIKDFLSICYDFKKDGIFGTRKIKIKDNAELARLVKNGLKFKRHNYVHNEEIDVNLEEWQLHIYEWFRKE